RFDQLLGEVEARYGGILRKLKWVSLGGGISFTARGYPVEEFCRRLRRFAEEYGVQVYLEPGEAAVRHTATLEVSVLDVGFNGKNLAVVDSSTEAHMLDLLIYRETAPLGEGEGEHEYMICG